MQLADNPKKAVNRVIRDIQKTNLKNVIVAVPTTEDITNCDEVCAKIMCKISSHPFSNSIHNILSSQFGVGNGDPFGAGVKAGGIGDISKLRSVVPDHVLLFISEFNRCIKMSQVHETITKHYFLEPERMEQLFNVVDICEVLDKRFIDSNKSKNHWAHQYNVSSAVIVGNLFNYYKFNTVINRSNKNTQDTTRKAYKALATEMLTKGSTIINKHS